MPHNRNDDSAEFDLPRTASTPSGVPPWAWVVLGLGCVLAVGIGLAVGFLRVAAKPAVQDRVEAVLAGRPLPDVEGVKWNLKELHQYVRSQGPDLVVGRSGSVGGYQGTRWTESLRELGVADDLQSKSDEEIQKAFKNLPLAQLQKILEASAATDKRSVLVAQCPTSQEASDRAGAMNTPAFSWGRFLFYTVRDSTNLDCIRAILKP